MKSFAILLLIGLVLTVGCSKDSNDNGPTGTVNHPPVIQSINASPQEVARNHSASIVCVATDADRDTLTYAWSTRFGSVSADGAEADWQAPAEAGTYWVKVIVNDGVALDVDSVQVTVAPNRPPVIESLSSSSPDVGHGGTITITCAASDPDNDVLRYTWTPSAGSIQGSGASVSWRAPQNSGNYWIRLRVNDGSESAFDSVQVTVMANRTPVIQAVTANPSEVEFGETISLTCDASDADDDALTYTWNVQSGRISGRGNNVSWIAPNVSGTFWLSVGVNDGLATVTDTAVVTVVPSNTPPSSPYAPDPPDANFNYEQPLSLNLTWGCDDADGDSLEYDVYFGTDSQLESLIFVRRDLTSKVTRVTDLRSRQVYFWKVIVRDSRGAEVTGPVGASGHNDVL